eukprot:SAG31_NODE_2458_length_5661_cov_2.020137_2_plen_61_part_00
MSALKPFGGACDINKEKSDIYKHSKATDESATDKLLHVYHVKQFIKESPLKSYYLDFFPP